MMKRRIVHFFSMTLSFADLSRKKKAFPTSLKQKDKKLSPKDICRIFLLVKGGQKELFSSGGGGGLDNNLKKEDIMPFEN